MSLKLFITSLPYWGLFAVNLFFDLYLSHIWIGVIIKAFLPIFVVINCTGVIFGMIELKKKEEKTIESMSTIILNLMPMVGIGSIILWWIFIFKI